MQKSMFENDLNLFNIAIACVCTRLIRCVGVQRALTVCPKTNLFRDPHHTSMLSKREIFKKF